MRFPRHRHFAFLFGESILYYIVVEKGIFQTRGDAGRLLGKSFECIFNDCTAAPSDGGAVLMDGEKPVATLHYLSFTLNEFRETSLPSKVD